MMDALAMLDRMAALMQYPDKNGLWHARRVGNGEFHHGETADEAMRKALGLDAKPAADDLFGDDIPNDDLFN